MGVSPTRQNGTRSDRFASKFDKKKRNKLQKDATTEIREAKQKLRKNKLNSAFKTPKPLIKEK